jgi:hypothetical protein
MILRLALLVALLLPASAGAQIPNFVAGQPLTAAQLNAANTILQAADAAGVARDTAITAAAAAAQATASAALPLAGGTLAGPLILPANPTLPLGAATKAYADLMLPLTGGTVSGLLTLTNNLSQTGSHTITVAGGGGTSTISGGTITTTHLNSGLAQTINFTGLTGGPTAATTALLTSINMTGTPASGTVSLHRFVVNADDLDGTNLLNGPSAFSIDHNFGGPNLRVGRTGALVNMTQTANITAQTAPGSNSFVVGGFHLATAFNLGGTNTAGGAKGFYYGLYPQLILHSGATNIALANLWGEGDIAVEAGASVKSIYGRSIVLLPSHAVAGTSENIVDLITAGGGAVPTWTNGYTFGGTGANWPMAATATLQGTIVQAFCGGAGKTCQAPTEAATYGTDWASLDLVPQSGFGFRSPGFAVDAVGQGWFANGLNLTATATGYSVDIPNAQAVTAVVPSTAGNATGDGQNNYYPGDLVYGSGSPTPGQYRITHTQVIAAVVAAGGSGGTPGACTVTGTTGTGTKFQATGTVTAGALGGALVVSVAGDYTVNPTSLTAEPVTGCGLTGATVGPGMGALTLAVQVPGVFAACPGAGGIAPTGGSGGALTLTPTCGVKKTLTLGASTTAVNIDATTISLANIPTTCTAKPAGSIAAVAGVLTRC